MQVSYNASAGVLFKRKWHKKFLLYDLKETLKIMYRSLLQIFYICFTLGDIVPE